MIAIAPTATIASIVGAYEATEPQISNLFKRETLSGEFIQVNRYLVEALKKRGLWNEDMRNRIRLAKVRSWAWMTFRKISKLCSAQFGKFRKRRSLTWPRHGERLLIKVSL